MKTYDDRFDAGGREAMITYDPTTWDKLRAAIYRAFWAPRDWIEEKLWGQDDDSTGLIVIRGLRGGRLRGRKE